MSRVLTIGVLLAMLPGCASTVQPRTPGPVVESPPIAFEVLQPRSEWLVPAALVESSREASPPGAETFTLPILSSTPPSAAAPLPEDDGDDTDNYLTAKLGYLIPSDSDLDDGYALNVAYGRYFTRLLAVEFEGGYLRPDPDASKTELEVVPLLVNGRVSIPVLFLEAYGGGGIGGMYYNVGLPGSDVDGWLLAGDLFLGADFSLFDLLTAGLELKYYLTDDIRNSNTDLSGLAVSLTAGLRF